MNGTTSKANSVKSVNLALQGGGAHGAFTWGVLETLLADPGIFIEAISGTSAGAMNAVLVADGLMRGGEEEAIAQLQGFWYAVSDLAMLSPIKRHPIDVMLGNWSLDNSPGYLMFDALSRIASPYDLNPLGLNPLRDILEKTVDFDRVRSCSNVKLYISATNVQTGRVKLFNHHELTADMVMASACLPHLYQAVEIDGIPYWDGGYMGNPPLYPFYHTSAGSDIIVVQINPMKREGAPKSAADIMNRVNEITFNSSLLSQLRSINFVTKLIDAGKIDDEQYRRIYVHMIHDQQSMKPLGASSKLNAERWFLNHLRSLGNKAADSWLEKNRDALGNSSTIDLERMFDPDIQYVPC